MRSKLFGSLMRILILAAGAGAGAAVAFLYVQIHDLTSDGPMALGTLILLYGGFGALGMLGGHLAAQRILGWAREGLTALEKWLESLTAAQLLSMAAWLMGGLVAASLLTQMLNFLGDSMFTLALSAICYVLMGVIGLSIGVHRADDMEALLSGSRPSRAKTEGSAKVADASILMDGRIVALRRSGIIEGELLTADFIQQEMQEQSISADAAKRVRAQRGLEAIRQLQADGTLTVERTGSAPIEPDVALMTLARERSATLLTADATMHKAARVAGLKVVNLNDVTLALRTVLAAGDAVALRITREGRESGQGVGYLEDGTMVVVEDARRHMGETITAVVTSVLQTSAGRMVFARMQENGGSV